MPRLIEYFIIREDTGRDLHDLLDVVLDMAQEGKSYEKRLHELIARIKTVVATGDMTQDTWIKSDTHSQSSQRAKGHSAWDFDRDWTSSSVHSPGLATGFGMQRGRTRNYSPLRYTGKAQDAEKISMWRHQAHSVLDFAMMADSEEK